MKKIEINKDICLGCGACCGIDEEHFEFGEDGFPEAKTNENLESPDLISAIEACPVGAITIEEVETQEKVNNKILESVTPKEKETIEEINNEDKLPNNKKETLKNSPINKEEEKKN